MKVLIWDYRIPLINCGGPSGYLSQIKNAIKGTEYENTIYFVSDILKKNNDNIFKKNSRKNLSSLGFLKYLRSTLSLYKSVSCPIKEEVITFNINEFTHIHFHSTSDLYLARNILGNYRGTILLTSHSPEPSADEKIKRAYGSKSSSIFIQYMRNFLLKIDLYAFRKADYLMFPVSQATEPYEVDSLCKNILELRADNIVCCPTCINDFIFDKDYIAQFRTKYGIPKDAFIVCYMGRHNEIKGYDILKDIAQKVLESNSNVYFVIAGNSGEIAPLQNKRWIEIGWTDKGNEIIAASDLFILPNRQTYFDLIALEVLRAGTPILMSFTGGNKYFYEKFPDSQCFQFFNISSTLEAVNSIEQLSKDTEKLISIKNEARYVWLNNFTMKNYLESYLIMLKKTLQPQNE